MISNEVVLHKMMKELQAAMKKADNDKAMLEHIGNIKLLTELFLDGNQKEQALDEQVTTSPVTPEQLSKQTAVTPTPVEHDGTSIFDF